MDGPPVMSPKFHLAQGDAVAWLRALPSESVDLVITDPPYESLEKYRAIGTTTRLKHSKSSSNDWFAIFPNDRFPELFTEVFRVLRRNSHFYLYCDPETMFVAKPLAEAAGFKFWKPLIWDKCLGPDTMVWTQRGVVRIADIREGDRVALPEGGSTTVRATRTTRAVSRRITLSDGETIVASLEHRFVLRSGEQITAGSLRVGDALCTRLVRQRKQATLDLTEVIPAEALVHELPDPTVCLWCGQPFGSVRAAAAHQARHCERARSKLAMAVELGLSPKRMRRWLSAGRIPRAWAHQLGLESKLGPRVQCYLQNDSETWFPREVTLDHDLGRFIGLYAAEGSMTSAGVSFACHADEKHLQAHVARVARMLGARARAHVDGNGCAVQVDYKIVQHIIGWFVGGTRAPEKFFKPSVYAAPEEFRRGVLAGLLEGDGHWSHDEQRSTLHSSSADLAMFARRELQAMGFQPTCRRFENEHAGGWKVRHDPIRRDDGVTVEGIEEIGEQELIDISVTDASELFLLANGVVTHNCKIGMGYHYRARYECILFFEKGKRKLADLGISDILEAPRISGGYPAEKPTAVSEILIGQSTDPGQLVIDPFMGSGSVGVAAVTLGRMFLGNDLCQEAVDITRERLRQAQALEVGAPSVLAVATPASSGAGRAGAGQLGLAGLARPGKAP
jgi:DNA modification methylase